jgi:hypothetical protein
VVCLERGARYLYCERYAKSLAWIQSQATRCSAMSD